MNQGTEGRIRRSKWSYAFAWLALAACGGAVGKPSVGGESHFLRHCGDGCGPGLECVADICTRGCRVDGGDCSDLAADARCTNESLEPGELAVCDVACEDAADCHGLGADFTCDSGYCRGPAPSAPGPGGGGSSSGGSSASGGSTSAGGSMSAGGTGQGGDDVCSLPFVQGPCEADFRVFAFIDGECRPASYGGCEGNENRFDTLEQCENRCGTKVPAARCLLPFDAGTCKAAIRVFAFQGGECAPAQYGGCEGNDNRFDTLEQCWNACEGWPSVSECPEGRVARQICTQCGPAGGCAQQETLCAQPCDPLEPVCDAGLTCTDGVCQVGQCI